MTFFETWQEIGWERGGHAANGHRSEQQLEAGLKFSADHMDKEPTFWRKTVVTWNKNWYMWCTCSLQCVCKLLTVTVCSIFIIRDIYWAIYFIHFWLGQYQFSIHTNDIYINQNSFSNWRHPHSVCCTCTIKIEPCIVWLVWPNKKFKTQSLRSLMQGHTVQILPKLNNYLETKIPLQHW